MRVLACRHPASEPRQVDDETAAVLAAARAEDISVSEWVRAMAAGHAAKAADAHPRRQEAGRGEGEAAGVQAGSGGGVRIGLLIATLLAERGETFAKEWLAAAIAADPDGTAIAAAFAQRHQCGPSMVRLLRAAAARSRDAGGGG